MIFFRRLAAPPLVWAVLFPLLASAGEQHPKHVDIFELCSAQPALDPASLGPFIDHELASPHDPALDAMSREQILSSARLQGAQECAEKLRGHEDIAELLLSYRSSGDLWRFGWLAFDTSCKAQLNARCISDEVSASAAIQSANSGPGGMTGAFRICSLSLIDDVRPTELKRCMDVAGDLSVTVGTVLECSETNGRGHSQSNGVVAGKAIRRCVAARHSAH